MPHAESPDYSLPTEDTTLPDVEEEPNHDHAKAIDPAGFESTASLPAQAKPGASLEDLFDDDDDEFASSGAPAPMYDS